MHANKKQIYLILVLKISFKWILEFIYLKIGLYKNIET